MAEENVQMNWVKMHQVRAGQTSVGISVTKRNWLRWRRTRKVVVMSKWHSPGAMELILENHCYCYNRYKPH